MTRGSTLHPPRDTPATGLKIHVVVVESFNSTAIVEFSPPQSTLVCLRPQVPPHQELAALHSVSIALAAIRETRDGCATSQGVLVGMLESHLLHNFIRAAKLPLQLVRNALEPQILDTQQD